MGKVKFACFSLILSIIVAVILVFIGFNKQDALKDIKKITKKILNLRIFSDSNDRMNLSINDVNGELLIVSQFTLYANCKKGNRPSFI